MTTITELAEVLQELLGKTADEVGRSSGFIQRARKLRGSSYAQTLVFGWMSNPASTMSELAQTAASVGVSISKQGLDERFSAKSAGFMEELLRRGIGQIIQGEAMRSGVLANFKAVHVQDSSVIRLPEGLREVWMGCNKTGAGSAGLKVSVDWELVCGCLSGIQLSAAKYPDQKSSVAQAEVAADSLQIRDLGYFNLKHFARQVETGSYFLSRFKASTRLYSADGQALEWVNLLLNCPDEQVDIPVLVGAQRLACRLLAWRVPDPVALQRRTQLQEIADDQCRPVSPKRWQTAHWSVYITNAPVHLLSLAQAQVLGKVRWQIEILFKLWKSDGLLDEWRTADPWRILTECFAKLLALLIQHWCYLLGLWHLPERSLHQAALLLRKHALLLATALSDFAYLTRALSIIQRALAACKMTASRNRPHAFQLILRGSLA